MEDRGGVVTWLGLSATYTPDELVMMAALKAQGRVREMETIHTMKALLGARIAA